MPKFSTFSLLIAMITTLTLAACETTTEILSDSFQEEIGEAASANVRIEVGFESATLSALESGDANLIAADLEYIGEIDFEISGSREKTVTLSEDNKDRVYTGDETLDWIIGLSPDLPIDLILDIRSGSLTAELSALQLTNADFEVNSGHLTTDFPVSDAAIPGSINVNSGSATLTLPAGSTVAFGETATHSGSLTIGVAANATFTSQELSVSSGQITLTVGENASFALGEISASSGAVTITLGNGVAVDTAVSISSGTVIFDLPDDAAVQVDVRDLTSGNVVVPDSFSMTSIGNDVGEGVYQSANFDDAESQISIVVEIASGDLIIR